MQYYAEVTEDTIVELNVHGAPDLYGVEITVRPETEPDLRRAVKQLGFEPRKMDPHLQMHIRRVPLTRDGEEVGKCTVSLWLDALKRRPEPTPALVRMIEEDRVAHA